MIAFKNLTNVETELLVRAPAYMSLLAANTHGRMDEEERRAAIRQSHIKSFRGAEELRGYYDEVEKKFTENIEELDHALPQGKEGRDAAIKEAMKKMDAIYLKLGPELSQSVRRSLHSYFEHVAHVHWNIFSSLLFPIPNALRH